MTGLLHARQDSYVHGGPRHALMQFMSVWHCVLSSVLGALIRSTYCMGTLLGALPGPCQKAEGKAACPCQLPQPSVLGVAWCHGGV